MEFVNECVIGGKVIAKTKENIVVKTVGLNFAGTEEFDHEHPVVVSEADLKKIKKGSRVRILGKFGIDEKRHTQIEAVLVETGYAGDDVNYGKIVGKAHRTFRSLPATADKQELGNLLVNTTDEGTLIVRGALFMPTCTRFNQYCTTGSWVKIGGRIQHRPFDNRKTGKPERMLEIVGADDLCEVLESAEIYDPIEAIKNEMLKEAI